MDNLKLINRLHLSFVTTLKANRLVSVWQGKAPGRAPPRSKCIHLQDLPWEGEALKHGLLVKLRELPSAVRLFKVAAPGGGIDWLITGGSHTGRDDSQTRLTADGVAKKNAVRWQTLATAPRGQAIGGHGQVPVPQGQIPAQSPGLLLSGLGLPQAARRGIANHSL